MESARDALVWVSALPSGSGPGEVVTERNLELARAVPLVAAIARKNGVKIASFGTSGGVAGNASKFESIFVPVPMTGDRLYKADVLLRGEYESYKSLLDFFDELRNSGVAVQSASIKGKAIDAVVRVAGV